MSTASIFIEAFDFLHHKYRNIMVILTSTRPIFNSSITPSILNSNDRWAPLPSQYFRIANVLHILVLSDTLQFANRLDVTYDMYPERLTGRDLPLLLNKQYFPTTLRRLVLGITNCPELVSMLANGVRTLEEVSFCGGAVAPGVLQLIRPLLHRHRLRKLTVWGDHEDQDMAELFRLEAGDDDSSSSRPSSICLEELVISASNKLSFNWLPSLKSTLQKLHIKRNSEYKDFDITSGALSRNFPLLANSPLRELWITQYEFQSVADTMTLEHLMDQMVNLTLESCKLHTLKWLVKSPPKFLQSLNLEGSLAVSANVLPREDMSCFDELYELRSLNLSSPSPLSSSSPSAPRNARNSGKKNPPDFHISADSNSLSHLKNMFHLEELKLHHNRIFEQHLKNYFSASSSISSLKSLSLVGCGNISGGLKHLPKDNNLQELILSETTLTSMDIEAIGECKHLRTLNLARCKGLVNSRDLNGLLSKNHASMLQSLNLEEIRTQDPLWDDTDDVEHSSASTNGGFFPNLEILSLASCNISANTMKMLTKNTLKELTLRRAGGVNDEVLDLIGDHFGESLTSLDLYECLDDDDSDTTGDGVGRCIVKLKKLKSFTIDYRTSDTIGVDVSAVPDGALYML